MQSAFHSSPSSATKPDAFSRRDTGRDLILSLGFNSLCILSSVKSVAVCGSGDACVCDFSRFALLLKSRGLWGEKHRCVPILQGLSLVRSKKEHHATLFKSFHSTASEYFTEDRQSKRVINNSISQNPIITQRSVIHPCNREKNLSRM